MIMCPQVHFDTAERMYTKLEGATTTGSSVF